MSRTESPLSTTTPTPTNGRVGYSLDSLTAGLPREEPLRELLDGTLLCGALENHVSYRLELLPSIADGYAESRGFEHLPVVEAVADGEGFFYGNSQVFRQAAKRFALAYAGADDFEIVRFREGDIPPSVGQFLERFLVAK